MAGLVGEFECKLDDKGRFLFPVGLRKQLVQSANETFMINRGFESCLTLYPMNEWEKISAKLQKLNLFKAENRKFYRFFHNGANMITLDNAGRLLLPKPLMLYAGIDKELVAFAYANRIELWDKTTYQAMMQQEGSDFANLAEQVMGDMDMGDDE